MIELTNIEQSGISVVICCYNSKDRIISTLKHLAEQKGTDFGWEVILVDNNSTDGTAKVSDDFWRNYPGSKLPPLRILLEPTPGTMYARMKGLVESRYRYILYCDDDNWLNVNYLKLAFSAITADSSIAAVGGIGELVFDNRFTPPLWIEKHIKSFGGPQGKIDGDTTYDKGCLYTAGAILDRAWINKLFSFGFESSLKGRDGKSLAAGEDTELTFALKLIGGRLYYSSALHFKHYMPGSRMRWQYLRKLWFSFGYTDFLISPYMEYFKKVNYNRSWILVICLKRLFVYGIKSLLDGLDKGSASLPKFHRAKGELIAILFSYSVYRKNKESVKKLAIVSSK